jgi:hypothetical protein
MYGKDSIRRYEPIKYVRLLRQFMKASLMWLMVLFLALWLSVALLQTAISFFISH